MKYYNLLYFQISGGILTNKKIQDCVFMRCKIYVAVLSISYVLSIFHRGKKTRIGLEQAISEALEELDQVHCEFIIHCVFKPLRSECTNN